MVTLWSSSFWPLIWDQIWLLLLLVHLLLLYLSALFFLICLAPRYQITRVWLALFALIWSFHQTPGHSWSDNYWLTFRIIFATCTLDWICLPRPEPFCFYCLYMNWWFGLDYFFWRPSDIPECFWNPCLSLFALGFSCSALSLSFCLSAAVYITVLLTCLFISH